MKTADADVRSLGPVETETAPQAMITDVLGAGNSPDPEGCEEQTDKSYPP